jgi:hypothetical protein
MQEQQQGQTICRKSRILCTCNLNHEQRCQSQPWLVWALWGSQSRVESAAFADDDEITRLFAGKESQFKLAAGLNWQMPEHLPHPPVRGSSSCRLPQFTMLLAPLYHYHSSGTSLLDGLGWAKAQRLL